VRGVLNLLGKFTIKSLWLNKKRSIVTVIGIMLFASLVTAIVSLYVIAIDSAYNYAIYEAGDYHVSFENVPYKDVAEFKQNRAIEKIYICKNIGVANIKTNDNRKEDEADKTKDIHRYLSIKGCTNDVLENFLEIKSGRMPENDGEIVVFDDTDNARKIGETITLDVGQIKNKKNRYSQNSDNEIINTRKKDYTIVGVTKRTMASMQLSNTFNEDTCFTYDKDDIKTDDVNLYVKYNKKNAKKWAKLTADIVGLDEELIKREYSAIHGGALTNDEIKKLDNIKYKIDINSSVDRIDNKVVTLGISMKEMIIIVISLFMIIFIISITAIFCIKNSFEISLSEKMRHYGMIKSIGATKKQMRKSVYYEAGIFSLIALPLGIILGMVELYLLVQICNYYSKNVFNSKFKFEFEVSLLVIIISIVIGVITIFLSSLKSAKKASKISAMDTIKSRFDINNKKIKTPNFIRKIFAIGGEISYKNLERNNKKYKTTVISIAITIIISIVVSGYLRNIYEISKLEKKTLFDTDISIGLNEYDEKIYNKYLETEKLDNITDCAFLRKSVIWTDGINATSDFDDLKNNKDVKNGIVFMNHKSLNIYTIGKTQYESYIKKLGLNYNDVKDKAILMNSINVEFNTKATNKKEKIINKYNINQGDKISGKVISKSYKEKNEDEDNNCVFEIASITNERPLGLKKEDDAFLILSDELFTKVIHQNEIDKLEACYKSSNPKQLEVDLQKLLKGVSYGSIINYAEDEAMAEKLLDLTSIFLYIFVVILLLIGITSIFNAITANVELRKKEFAMLKSIGMTKRI